MPQLYLPATHSDEDLALAADVAAAVGSDDLYVAWSHAEGAGVIPEVRSVVRDQQPVNPFTEVLAALARGIVALVQALTARPAPGPTSPARPAEAPRTVEFGEPSA